MFEPVGSKIIVEERTGPNQTSGGIYLPEAQVDPAEPSLQGVVRSVGPDCLLRLIPGDEVVVHRHEAIPFREEGIMYYIVTEKSVWGKKKKTEH